MPCYKKIPLEVTENMHEAKEHSKLLFKISPDNEDLMKKFFDGKSKKLRNGILVSAELCVSLFNEVEIHMLRAQAIHIIKNHWSTPRGAKSGNGDYAMKWFIPINIPVNAGQRQMSNDSRDSKRAPPPDGKFLYEFGYCLKDILEPCRGFLGFLTDEEERLSFVFKVYRRNDIPIPRGIEKEAVLVICVDSAFIEESDSCSCLHITTAYVKSMSWWMNLPERGRIEKFGWIHQ
ncbi:hypothetical protein FO519_004403 [Halicephalobus sp. NKZ332]|nr:hypothetical protein FO519_004403 [Halicephalobus sp. NKZ332]